MLERLGEHWEEELKHIREYDPQNTCFGKFLLEILALISLKGYVDSLSQGLVLEEKS